MQTAIRLTTTKIVRLPNGQSWSILETLQYYRMFDDPRHILKTCKYLCTYYMWIEERFGWYVDDWGTHRRVLELGVRVAPSEASRVHDTHVVNWRYYILTPISIYKH